VNGSDVAAFGNDRVGGVLAQGRGFSRLSKRSGDP
jgi:hypothetical protein